MFDVIAPYTEDQAYWNGLNVCFPGWGNEIDYMWTFRRAMAGRQAERLVYRDGAGEMIAGTAISFRLLSIPSYGVVPFGIMTGSWTLPAARGRGIFSEAIRASLARVQIKDCAGLLAFVTEDNPSARALIKAGSTLVPTRYIFAPAAGEPAEPAFSRKIRLLPPSEIIGLHKNRTAALNGALHFAYPSADDFLGQYFYRPNATQAIEGDGFQAIIEIAPKDMRVLYLYCPGDRQKACDALLALARRLERRIFLFASGDWVPDGFQHKKGYITILHTSDADPASTAAMAAADHWAVPAGDRM